MPILNNDYNTSSAPFPLASVGSGGVLVTGIGCALVISSVSASISLTGAGTGMPGNSA